MSTPGSMTPGGALSSRLISGLLRSPEPTLPRGALLGAYRIVRMLDRGGLGEVYLAERADGTFEQQVAIKLIHPDAERHIARALLDRERRLLARLRHRGIAGIVDGGDSAAGIWFAMEYVEGQRLDRYCDSHQLPLGSRLQLFLKICDAVAYAHARLIVHRDIKPANILVDADGEPRLLDFGIAAALDANDDETTYRNAATPSFSSPEQNRGEAPIVASDIFQLGRLLQQLVANVDAPIDKRLLAILQRAQHARSESRYPSVDALVSDIRAFLDHRPVSALRESLAHRMYLFARRNRWAVAIATATAAVFFTTIGVFTWDANRSRNLAVREAMTTQRVNDFIIDIFRAASPTVHAGEKPSVDQLLAQARQRIQRDLTDEPSIKGEMLTTVGRVYAVLEDWETAEPIMHEAVGLGEQDRGLAPDKLALRKRVYAWILARINRQQDARAQLEQADDLLRNVARAEELKNLIKIDLAMIDARSGKYEDGLASLRTVVSQARSPDDAKNLDLISGLCNLGQQLAETGRTDEAIVALSEAHTRAVSIFGADHPLGIGAAGVLAQTLAKAGRFDEANELSDRMTENALRVFGAGSPKHIQAISTEGELMLRKGDIGIAIDKFREAIALSEQLPPDNDIYSVDAWEFLGDALSESGQPFESAKAYAKADKLKDDGRFSMSPEHGELAWKFARSLAQIGQCDLAHKERDEAIALALKLPPSHPFHEQLRLPLIGCPTAGSGLIARQSPEP